CHLFFFPSRSRHTRFSRDWSSDVCSSDLELHIVEHVLMMGGAILMWWPIYPPVKELASLNPPAKALYLFAINLAQLGVFAYVTRSAERRVGKEVRARQRPAQYRNKAQPEL